MLLSCVEAMLLVVVHLAAALGPTPGHRLGDGVIKTVTCAAPGSQNWLAALILGNPLEVCAEMS